MRDWASHLKRCKAPSKTILTICLLAMLSVSRGSYANISMYFPDLKLENVRPFPSPIEKESSNRVENVYGVSIEQGKKYWEKVREKEQHTVNPGESLFFQVPGLSLIRLDLPANQPSSDTSGSVDIYQVHLAAEDLQPSNEANVWTRIKVAPVVDEAGRIYIRTPVGDVISYEIRNRLEQSLKIGCFIMEPIPGGSFWNHLEQRFISDLGSNSIAEFMMSMMEQNTAKYFIERQFFALPWLPQKNMTEAERQYRAARFFHDILYEKRRDKRRFKEKILTPAESKKTCNVGAEVFYEARPAIPISFHVTGPKLIKLRTRFIYPKNISDEVQSYTISCYRDNLLRKILYKTTVPDDLQEVVLDDAGRLLGRERVEYLLVPPGDHRYRLSSEYNVLIRLHEYEKKLNLLASLTNSENSGAWAEKSLKNVETMLKLEPDDPKLLYLKGCCLKLMDFHKESLAVYELLSTMEAELSDKGEFLILTGIYIHLAQLYMAEGKYAEALDLLSSALTYCEKSPVRGNTVILNNALSKKARCERADIFRRMGKHSEAAEEYKLILARSPMDAEIRFHKAQTLAWIKDLTALAEYDRVLQLSPGDAVARNARQRFWWDYTYWQRLSPQSKQQGESHRILDQVENKPEERQYRERTYFAIPRTQPALKYCVDSLADTYIRGLAYVKASGEEPSCENVLIVSIDDSVEALVILENKADSTALQGQPHEFILPLPAGYHKVKIWQRDGTAEAILNLSCRALRTETAETVSKLTGEIIRTLSLPEQPQEPKRADDAAKSYYHGREILDAASKSGRSDTQEQFIDAVRAFTKAIYLAAESDPIKYQAYLGRSDALHKLGKPEFALSDCKKVAASLWIAEALRAQAWLQSAIIYVDMGEEQKALEEYALLLKGGFDSMIKMESQNPQALLNRAMFQIRKHQLIPAALTLNKLSSLPSESPDHARYLRGKVAFLLGDFDAAKRYLEPLCNDDSGSSPAEIALRCQSKWELQRIAEASSIFELLKDEPPPASRTSIYRRIAEFNSSWVESPSFSFRKEISKLYDNGYWEYIGDEGIIDYTVRTRAIIKDSGASVGDHFFISDEAYVVLQVDGPGFVRLDVRPVHHVSEMGREADIEVKITSVRHKNHVIPANAGIQNIPEYSYLPEDWIPAFAGMTNPPRIVPNLSSRKRGTSVLSGYLCRTHVKIEEAGIERQADRIAGNKRSEEVIYPELTNIIPGRKKQIVYRVGTGIHRLKVQTASGIAHFRPYILRPGAGTGFIVAQNGLVEISQSDGTETHLLPNDAENLTKRAKTEEEDHPEDFESRLDLASIYLSLGDQAADVALSTYYYNSALNIYTFEMQAHPELDAPAKGFALARSKTRWQRIRTVQSSAGYEDILSNKAEPLKFSLKIREALLPPIWADGSYVLVGAQNGAVFSISLPRPSMIAVQFFGQEALSRGEEEKRSGYCILYSQNGEPKGMFEGRVGEIASREIGILDAGQHILQFALKEPDSEELVMMKLLSDEYELQSRYSVAESSAQEIPLLPPVRLSAEPISSEFYTVEPNIVRRNFVASCGTPVQTFIQGPTQLRLVTRYIGTSDAHKNRSFSVRIRERDGNVTQRSYSIPPEQAEFDRLRSGEKSDKAVGEAREVITLIPKGLCEVSVAPDSTGIKLAVRMYTRVSERMEADLQSPDELAARNGHSRVNIVEKSPDALPLCWRELPQSKPIAPPQKYGTLEIALGYGADIESELGEEKRYSYNELLMRHRYHFGTEMLYHKGAFGIQLINNQEPVLKAEESIYYRFPLKISSLSRLKAYLNCSENARQMVCEFRTEVSRNLRVAPDLTIIPRVGYVYKNQFLDAGDTDRYSAPAELFSTYDRQHERQVFFENILWYKPFLDVIVSCKGRIKTNRELNPAHPDYYYVRSALKKLWSGKLKSSIYHEVRRWIADENRRESRWENSLYTSFEYAFWKNRTRLLFHVSNRYSIEQKEIFLYAGFRCAFSASGTLQDYSPREIDFEMERSLP